MSDLSVAESVRDFLKNNPDANINDVVSALRKKKINVNPRYVSSIKSRSKQKSKVTNKKSSKPNISKIRSVVSTTTSKYPRHNLERSLRIPAAILEQNAGRECSEKDAATFIGVKYNKGPFVTEISSGLKFGLLERPSAGHIKLTELAKRILRPQAEEDKINGLRTAVLKAPDISDVYEHYRGENLPDAEFFDNALIDKFGISSDKVSEFKTIFFDTLNYASLINETEGKWRVLDVSGVAVGEIDTDARIKKLVKNVNVNTEDSCFVMMPFASPHGEYYKQIFEPAIRKAGLNPLRADAEIFGTGKIIDQIWRGITNSKVLIAELTTRNPNVFYELGMAHALRKPVVLISGNAQDVPFDLKHIRVIYYDVSDPFWGQKLMDKVAENILSALKNPEETLFPTENH